MRYYKENKKNSDNNIIVGRNPVLEAIKAKRSIGYILVSSSKPSGSLIEIIGKAKSLGIEIKKTTRENLDSISNGVPHQGVIAVGCAKRYCVLEDILELANKKNEPPFIIILDGIEDPRNLGAIIRTAECAGVHGIVIPKRRAVGLTYTVEKTSAGALEHILVAKEANISLTIEKLKKHNIWVFGADASGSTWCQQTLTGPIALVLGAEGKGLSKLVKEKCDSLISLPMVGKINSLNVSVAAAIITYEILRQRLKI